MCKTYFAHIRSPIEGLIVLQGFKYKFLVNKIRCYYIKEINAILRI